MAKVNTITIGNFRVVKDPSKKETNVIAVEHEVQGEVAIASIVAMNLQSSIGSLSALASMIRFQVQHDLVGLADSLGVPIPAVEEPDYPTAEELFEILYP